MQIGVLVLGFGVALAEAPTLDVYVEAAIQRSPALAADASRRMAAEAETAVARSWQDPMLSLSYSQVPIDTLRISDHPMSGVQFQLSQRFPTSGVTGAAGAVAEAREAEVLAVQADTTWALVARVSRAWWRWLGARRGAELVASQRSAMAQRIDAGLTSYQAGTTAPHHVWHARTAWRALEDVEDQHRQQARALAAELEVLTGLQTPDGPLPELVPVAPPEAEAAANGPGVQVLEARASLERTRARWARRTGLPDVTVQLGYRVRTAQTPTDSGVDLLTLGVSVPIPVVGARRGAGAAKAALGRASALEADREARLDELRVARARVLAEWQHAYDKAVRYDEILLPEAASMVSSARSGYAAGRVALSVVHDAEVAWWEAQRSEVSAIVDTHVLEASYIGLTYDSTMPGGQP